MIRKRPEKDIVNPPGQVRPPSPDTLQHNIEEWKKYEESRNIITPKNCGCNKCDGSCMHD